MKRTLSSLVVLAAALALSPASTAAQQPPEAKALGEVVGEWKYDHMEGNAQCRWLGDLIIYCESEWIAANGSKAGQLITVRWDPQAKLYTSSRFYMNGYADAGVVWYSGGIWTFVYDAPMGDKVKCVSRVEGPAWRYTWYRSRAGGDWEKTSEGSMTRVASPSH